LEFSLGEVEFEWDKRKATQNLEKHGISFELATRIFLDPNRALVERRATEYGENRFALIGNVHDMILFVVYTLRADKIRIISARKAHKNERQQYEAL